MSNESATALMRATAEAWYIAHERHAYSGLVHGLSAVLHEQGVDIAPMRGADGSDGLSTILHDALCSIDPHAFDVAHIAHAVDATLARDSGSSHWVDPGLHRAYRSRGSLVDWIGLALEVRGHLKAAKIRKGSRRAAEFYAEKRATVVPQIRTIVANAIEARMVGAKCEAVKIRAEIAPLRKKADYVKLLVDIREALFSAAGIDTKANSDGVLLAKVAEYERRIQSVEAAAAYVERNQYDVETVFAEGMSAHDELAPFLTA